MKYQIEISGMHCSGCKNLIAMCLEDEGLENVFVDLEKNNASFTSKNDSVEVEKLLQKVFKELPDYKYLNLTVLD